MAVVESLHCVLQAERDEQAYRDGEDVQQEVAHTIDAVVRRMDIQHRFVSGKDCA